MLSTTDPDDVREAVIDPPRRAAPDGWVAASDVEAMARLVECLSHVVDPGQAVVIAVMQFDEMHPTARPIPFSLALLRACAAVEVGAVGVVVPTMVYGRFVPLPFTLAVADLLGSVSPGR